MVNEKGVKRYCEMAASNLDSMDNSKRRFFFEAMNLRILANEKIIVKLSLPAAMNDENIIVLCTSQSDGR